MAAPTNAAKREKALANPEPSTQSPDEDRDINTLIIMIYFSSTQKNYEFLSTRPAALGYT